MLWNDLVIQATGWLAAKGLESPAADAREIAEVAAGSSLHKASDPTTQQRDRFAEMVVQRGERVPLQHVTGGCTSATWNLPRAPDASLCGPRRNWWQVTPSMRQQRWWRRRAPMRLSALQIYAREVAISHLQ